MPRLRSLVLLVLAVLGCATYQQLRLDRRYGEARVRDREAGSLPAGAVDYASQVRPILEARCVVCHACYDAPCQLDLGSPEGIDRGGTTAKVYDGTRLLQTDPTRLFEDAQTTAEWRKKDFHPVLNERKQTPRANREASLLFRSLALKRKHPVVPGALLPDDVTLGLDRDAKCPTIEEAARHGRTHPQWGMPYGLPGLTEAEHATIVQWIEEGARHGATPPLPDADAEWIAKWEALLNADAPKARLASRYIYEHLFLAHLWFEEGRGGAPPRFFELVRSTTPPGEPVDRIATRRPYDDPKVARPYYRIVPVHEAIVAKLHLPYRMDAARMARWKSLLFDAEYDVTDLPSYDVEVASNPFVAFRSIPARARYRFMLEEAEFTIMGFIKGAVCRGGIALNVIDDQFWVFFVDPEAKLQLHDGEFLFANAKSLRMPAEASSNARPLATWLQRSKDQLAWAKARQAALREDLAGGESKLDLSLVWDGDGDNRNAALTVFRHYDSATVVKGTVGDAPKTAWVISYPMLERIHYLLVAGFDVYGNVGHQLSTRTYMDFLRLESEAMFLSLLPDDARVSERAHWYRETEERAYAEIVEKLTEVGIDTAITYETRAQKVELFGKLRKHLDRILERRWDLDQVPDDIATPLRALASTKGARLEHVPQTAFILVPDAPRGAQVFTLVRNDGHTNIASPFGERKRRLPNEHTLTIARGFVGTFPNAFFVAPRAQLGAFAEQLAGVRSEADYARLQQGFGVRRTDTDFWTTSDRLVAILRETSPIEAGLLDLNRYENR